jgi:hypothetical protein
MTTTADELQRRLSAGALATVQERLLSRILLTVEGNVKRSAMMPVRTGTLRRSITHRVERPGERGVVGTNVSYAKAVHVGRGKRKGKPFLTAGMAASRDTIQHLLRDAGQSFFSGSVQ